MDHLGSGSRGDSHHQAGNMKPQTIQRRVIKLKIKAGTGNYDTNENSRPGEQGVNSLIEIGRTVPAQETTATLAENPNTNEGVLGLIRVKPEYIPSEPIMTNGFVDGPFTDDEKDLWADFETYTVRAMCDSGGTIKVFHNLLSSVERMRTGHTVENFTERCQDAYVTWVKSFALLNILLQVLVRINSHNESGQQPRAEFYWQAPYTRLAVYDAVLNLIDATRESKRWMSFVMRARENTNRAAHYLVRIVSVFMPRGRKLNAGFIGRVSATAAAYEEAFKYVMSNQQLTVTNLAEEDVYLLFLPDVWREKMLETQDGEFTAQGLADDVSNGTVVASNHHANSGEDGLAAEEQWNTRVTEGRLAARAVGSGISRAVKKRSFAKFQDVNEGGKGDGMAGMGERRRK